MELKAEQKIEATREQVYAALNDPEILRQCIPGCETLEKTSETEMTASVVLKVGPVKAKFKGQVELSNLTPPESYSITGEGTGGAAGFAKGGADIKLLADGTATRLLYEVHADVGGRIAQLGGRLIDSTAKKLSAQFFAKFCDLIEAGTQAPSIEAASDPTPNAQPAAANRIWIGLAIGVAVVIIAVALSR